MEEAGDEGFGHEQAAAVAGRQGGGLVEEGAGVEDLEQLGVGVPDDLEVTPGKGGETLGKLAATGCVNSLEETPVAARGESQVVVVGQALRPVSAKHAKSQVFVDDDQAGAAASVGRVVDLTAEQRVSVSIGVEGRLELIG